MGFCEDLLMVEMVEFFSDKRDVDGRHVVPKL